MKRLFMAGLLIFAISPQSLGCSGLAHGYTLSDYQGQVLRCTAEAGRRRLEIEGNYDGAIRNWASQDPPDYILVKSRSEVQLFYVRDRRTVTFKRGFMPDSVPSIQEGIGKEVSAFFSREDQGRLAGAPTVGAPEEL